MKIDSRRNSRVNPSRQDRINMELKQLGATIKSVHGIICYISFEMKDVKITYLYNINKHNEYFLQRINPYTYSFGSFSKEQDIVDFIKKDIAKFEKASEHYCFSRYITLNKCLKDSLDSIEELYLNRDMTPENFSILEQALSSFNNTIALLEKNNEQ